MQSYDLTLAAEEDLRGTWRYTYETWGFEQAETDRIACGEAVGDRRAQPKTHDGLPGGIRIHRCERHHIVWLDKDRPVVIAIHCIRSLRSRGSSKLA